MALETLTAKANVGAGTDALAVETIDGKLVGIVRTTDETGVSAEVSTEETLAMVQNVMVRLLDALGSLSPDALNRLRVNVEAGTVAVSSGTITTVTTVTTVTTCATVTNLAQFGGIAANQAMTALQIGSEADLRRNIVIS